MKRAEKKKKGITKKFAIAAITKFTKNRTRVGRKIKKKPEKGAKNPKKSLAYPAKEWEGPSKVWRKKYAANASTEKNGKRKGKLSAFVI